MFCKNCGEKIIHSNTEYCSNCGVNFKRNTQIKDSSKIKIPITKSKKKIAVIIGSILFIVIAIFLSFIIYSLVKPDSKFAYRNIFIDNKTHTYQQSQTFQYGSYDFQIKSSTEDIKYTPVDCSLGDGFEKIRLYMEDNCKTSNEKRKTQGESNKNLTITISAKNRSNNIHSLDTNWFKVKDSSGKQYSWISSDFATNDILPGQTRVGRFSDIIIDKNLKGTDLIISLPNSASQIVNLDF